MKTESVMYLSEKEEELAELLIKVGVRTNVALVLVYLANIPEATTRTIERGTGLRQAEVSLAMQYLGELQWVSCRHEKSLSKGRPMKCYQLAKPLPEIMNAIVNEKKKSAYNQLVRIQRIRECIG